MPDETPAVAAEAAAEEAAEVAVAQTDTAAEKASAATVGQVEELLVKHVGPLSDRVLALEQRGEAVVQAPPAAVERAVTEAEPTLVRPKRKHPFQRLPRWL